MNFQLSVQQVFETSPKHQVSVLPIFLQIGGPDLPEAGSHPSIYILNGCISVPQIFVL